jgi:hypothetical protein
MQVYASRVVDSLSMFTLSTSNRTIPSSDPQLKALLAYSSFLNDQRVLFKHRPTATRYKLLRAAVTAAFQAPAAFQAGLSSYVLLSPAIRAVQDFYQLARGHKTCMASISKWEASLLATRGQRLWDDALSTAKQWDGTTPELS